jgi:hypothetical protein
MKQASLFCHTEISQIVVLHAALLVCSESSCWVRVHWLGLRLFGAMAWKLLIIQSFSQWKINKIKIDNCIGIWRHSWCFWKVLDESDLIRFISQFWELRCGRYWFLSAFWCWKFKQIEKIRIGRKNQLSPQCVHTWANSTGYSSNNNLPDNFLMSWKLIRERTRLVTW